MKKILLKAFKDGFLIGICVLWVMLIVSSISMIQAEPTLGKMLVLAMSTPPFLSGLIYMGIMAGKYHKTNKKDK